MRNLLAFLLTVSVLIFAGCSSAKENSPPNRVAVNQPTQPDRQQAAGGRQLSQSAAATSPTQAGASAENISISDAATAQAANTSIDRKIIRNAEMTIETESPTDGQQRITAIAESLGGFVVTSEYKQDSGQGKPNQSVMVVARVPSSQFNSALEQIRGIGGKVVQSKTAGQDVSEEYLDLEARIRAKKALEAQFLEIMKQAKKVSDALDVQNELANVRTEIERLEGRRRFLENQSALSTITINLQLPPPVVATTGTGFGQEIKEAFGAAIDIAAGIVLLIIRAVIVLLPFGVIFGLPGWLLWRFLRRRYRVNAEVPRITES
jgi:hypothetical protein